MTQIDSDVLKKVAAIVNGKTELSCVRLGSDLIPLIDCIVSAYESVLIIKSIDDGIYYAPRTISRDELEVAVNARQGYLMRQRDPIRNIVPVEQEAMQAALATLGITVEGE